MKSFSVVPTKGIDGLKFGENRENIRNALGNYTEFKKSRFSKNTTDNFGYCHAYYDTENRLIAVEFFEECSIYVDNKLVFPTTIVQTKSTFNDLAMDGESYISHKQSVGVSVIDKEEKSIIIAKEGYFD